MDSPALSIASSLSDEELEAYFANQYVPLSSLPTPPTVAKDKVSTVTVVELEPENMIRHDLIGCASYLSRLVPSDADKQRPSVETINSFLERTELPQEVLGLAACILNALSPRFASAWNTVCPREPFTKRSCWKMVSCAKPIKPAVSSEIIILSSLALALDFLEDLPTKTYYWTHVVAGDLFTPKDVQATSRAILQDIDYGLHRFTADMVDAMIEDMRQVEEMSMSPFQLDLQSRKSKERKRPKLSIHLPGTTILKNGLYTPGPSP